MAKKTDEELRKIPEDVHKEPVVKTEIDKDLEAFKEKHGIDVEPVKTNKYKIQKAINYLNEKYQFRYNLFIKRPEYKKLDGKKDFEVFEERDCDNLFNELDYSAGISIGQKRLDSLVGSNLISNDYNPIEEYIKGLPKWDGKDRFPYFLSQITLMDEKNNRDSLIKYFTKWFVTMVASLVDHNVINETAIVFSGMEGRGKTRFFRNLVPDQLALKYFYDSVFNPRDKDHEEFLGTKILIFLDEMATLTRTDAETLKTTMSKRTIVLRRAYGRGNIHLWRKASFCGAINDDKFLVDQGANRRWLPFYCDSIEVDYDFNIDLLYAQALALFKDKFNIFYDREDIDELRKRNEQFRRRPPEEDQIMLHWTKPTEDELKEGKYLQYLTATDVMYALAAMDEYKKMNTNDSVAKRVGRTLSALEFPSIPKRIKGYPTPRNCYIMKPVDSVNISSIKEGKESADSSFEM